MTKPTAPAIDPIPLTAAAHDKKLQHTVGMFNAMIQHDVLHLFPANLSAAMVRTELADAVKSDEARGKARGTYHISVEDRRAVEAEAELVMARLRLLIEGGMPIGTPGRADFYPVENSNPTDGDVLISYGKGTQKHGWPRLPNGWTPNYVQDLGTRLNQAQDHAGASAAGRSGQTKASKSISRNVSKLRTRMRQLLEGWFGTASAELMKFGLQPRKPPTGRRPKAKGAAIVAAADEIAT